MLIKDLPDPIRKLAEKRFIEFVTPYKNISNDVNSAYIDSFSWSKTEKYGEGPSFWISIHNGDFTPYYAMYGLPEKWCIKCLQGWINNKQNPNKDWERCVKSIKFYYKGIQPNYFYFNNGSLGTHIKEGYTEITLSDWIAANPEKKEEKVDLPEKWAIKCLPEFLEKESWYELVKTIGEGFDGKSVNNFYHKDIGVFHCLKDEYTEITLDEWLAANPEPVPEITRKFNEKGIPEELIPGDELICIGGEGIIKVKIIEVTKTSVVISNMDNASSRYERHHKTLFLRSVLEYINN